MAVLAVALVMACGERPPSSAQPVPGLEAAAIERLLAAADDARDRAFANADPGPLATVFSAAAARPLARRLVSLRRAGVAVEEVPETRRLVHWRSSSDGAEGVLEIRARQRVLHPAASPGPWSTLLRQWRGRLEREREEWRVAEGEDLPPAQWWPVRP